jgi:cytochrome c oxidase assembly protein subunit 15
MAPNSTPTSRGVYRFAVATASFTVLLLMAGALVTSNDAADSVPDWPLAYGRLIPPLVGGIRYEYAHRVVAALVSILTLTLAIWLTAAAKKPLAKWLGWTAVVLVIAQAGLGALRVEEFHPILSATAHATLAQIFFITLVGLALYVSPWWQREQPQLEDSGSPRVRSLALWTTFVILVQLVLGAAFRHGAFGTGQAALVPHLIGAGAVTAMVIWTGAVAKRRFGTNADIRKSVVLLHAFFGTQILLGFAAWWAVTIAARDMVQPTLTYVILTVAHVLGGALTLAASVLLTLRCVRLIRGAGAAEFGEAAGQAAHPTGSVRA